MNIPPVKSLACFKINTETLEASQHLGRHLIQVHHLHMQATPEFPLPQPTPAHPTPPGLHSDHLSPSILIPPWHRSQRPFDRKVCVNSWNIPAIFSKALRAFCRKPFMRFSNVPPQPPCGDYDGDHVRVYWNGVASAEIRLRCPSSSGLHYAYWWFVSESTLHWRSFLSPGGSHRHFSANFSKASVTWSGASGKLSA